VIRRRGYWSTREHRLALLLWTNLESDGAGATDVRRAVAMSEKQRCAEMLSLVRAVRAVAASEADAGL
jgi:hypothetical protein